MNDFDAFLDIQRAGDSTPGRLLTDDVVSIGLQLPKSASPPATLTTGDHRLASAWISATTRDRRRLEQSAALWQLRPPPRQHARPLRPSRLAGSDRVSTVRLRSDLCCLARKCSGRCRPQNPE